MTTPRDLLFAALDAAAGRPVAQGELSLALAGAELVDLVGAQAVSVDDDRVVPGARWALADRLLDEAVASLERAEPYESVEDWLWRRGRGLASAYLAALEAEGQAGGRRHRWLPLPGGRERAADSPERRRAADRWASGEPVLASLGAAAGLREEPAGEAAGSLAEAVRTVLDTVHDAVTELAAVRQRRSIEKAAFDNVWRGA